MELIELVILLIIPNIYDAPIALNALKLMELIEWVILLIIPNMYDAPIALSALNLLFDHVKTIKINVNI